MEPTAQSTPPKHRVHLDFSFDLRIIVALLVFVIVAMFAIWKPWVQAPQVSDRTVSVTGSATISAEPDQYVFSPSYSFADTDRTKALDAANKKANEIVSKLKALGVADKSIKTDVNGLGYAYGGVATCTRGPYYDQGSASTCQDPNPSPSTTYSLLVTVTVDKRDVAQKVEDYLVTTSPSGTVTPQITFSDQKRQTLDNQARDKATKDARAKASQMAKNLGFKLGAVKSVDDKTGLNPGPFYSTESGANQKLTTDVATQVSVQPGENDYAYSLTVVYYVK